MWVEGENAQREIALATFVSPDLLWTNEWIHPLLQIERCDDASENSKRRKDLFCILELVFARLIVLDPPK